MEESEPNEAEVTVTLKIRYFTSSECGDPRLWDWHNVLKFLYQSGAWLVDFK